MASIPKHRHPVGNAADFGHSVGDVNDPHTHAGQSPDQGKELLGLRVRETCRGFVKDQHREIGTECLRDFDHLLLRARQACHRTSGRKIEPQVGQKPFRVTCHSGTVEKDALPTFLAEEQVLLHRHLRHQGKLLEHGGNAEFPGIVNRMELDAFPVHFDTTACRPVGAGEQGDQRRLACTVLAEDDVNFACEKVEVHAIKSADPREIPGDATGGEKRCRLAGHRYPLLDAEDRCESGRRQCGGGIEVRVVVRRHHIERRPHMFLVLSPFENAHRLIDGDPPLKSPENRLEPRVSVLD